MFKLYPCTLKCKFFTNTIFTGLLSLYYSIPTGSKKHPNTAIQTHVNVTIIALISVTSLNPKIPINTAKQMEHSLTGIAKL